MSYRRGADSAYGPSFKVAQAAKASGWSFWFGYLGGPGAFRGWTNPEWAILEEAGLTPGCLWVPTMTLTESPTIAAQEAIGAAASAGLYGAIMLDTEAMMADDATLVSFVDAFYGTLVNAGLADPIYEGAGYAPAGAPQFLPLWGSTAYPNNGQCIQYGPNPGALLGGVIATTNEIDVDLAGAAFPMASFTPIAPPPAPPPPLPPPVPVSLPSYALDPQEGQMFSWCYAPDGVRKDAVWVNSDNSVSHGVAATGDLTQMTLENLGGKVSEVACSWDPSAATFDVIGVGESAQGVFDTPFRMTWTSTAGWSAWWPLPNVVVHAPI